MLVTADNYVQFKTQKGGDGRVNSRKDILGQRVITNIGQNVT